MIVYAIKDNNRYRKLNKFLSGPLYSAQLYKNKQTAMAYKEYDSEKIVKIEIKEIKK